MTNPTKPVIDFDHHGPDFARRGQEILADLRERCPVAWSEHYGGFWLLTRHEDIFTASRDTDTFSSHHDMDGSQPELQGVALPPAPIRPIPIEVDPPDFYKYRHLLNPWFTPAYIERWEPHLWELTHEHIDNVIESGRFDIVWDLGNPVPARFTLEFLGLDGSDWRHFAEAIHKWIYTPPESPERMEAAVGFAQLTVAVYEAIVERRAMATLPDDLLSHLVKADGESKLTDDEIALMGLLVIIGGIDTTTGLFANAAHFLHRNHEIRDRLRNDASLIPLACEEFLRFATPTQALARTVKQDTEIRGQTLRKGERILMCYASANHDPAVFDRPDEFVIDRFPNRHTSFGLGIHRCVGSNVARREFAIMLEAMLDRMADFVVLEDEATPYESVGIVRGWINMPATFTPGRKR